MLVDDAHDVVVELGAREVDVVSGVVALAAEDVDELDVGVEEAAAFADRLEPAVELERSRAVSVAEETTMAGDVVAFFVVGWSGRERVGL